MNARFFFSSIMRPIISRMPRGSSFLTACFGHNWKYDKIWANAPRRNRVFLDKTVGANIYADLGAWAERLHYFRGEHYDAENRLLIEKALGEGDTYIDIGANRGIHTLQASRIVGPSGRVIAFEPNPRAFDVLKAHLVINRIANCTVYNMGLSDAPGKLTLHGPDGRLTASTGSFSFREIPSAGAHIKDVPVSTGDEILKDTELTGRVLVKIDTEGFEYHVIGGLSRLLQYDDLGISVEITDEWLRGLGASADEVFDHLMSRGFKAFQLTVSWRRLFTRVLNLVPLDGPLDIHQHDVLFAKDRFLSDFSEKLSVTSKK